MGVKTSLKNPEEVKAKEEAENQAKIDKLGRIYELLQSHKKQLAAVKCYDGVTCDQEKLAPLYDKAMELVCDIWDSTQEIANESSRSNINKGRYFEIFKSDSLISLIISLHETKLEEDNVQKQGAKKCFQEILEAFNSIDTSKNIDIDRLRSIDEPYQAAKLYCGLIDMCNTLGHTIYDRKSDDPENQYRIAKGKERIDLGSDFTNKTNKMFLKIDYFDALMNIKSFLIEELICFCYQNGLVGKGADIAFEEDERISIKAKEAPVSARFIMDNIGDLRWHMPSTRIDRIYKRLKAEFQNGLYPNLKEAPKVPIKLYDINTVPEYLEPYCIDKSKENNSNTKGKKNKNMHAIINTNRTRGVKLLPHVGQKDLGNSIVTDPTSNYKQLKLEGIFVPKDEVEPAPEEPSVITLETIRNASKEVRRTYNPSDE